MYFHVKSFLEHNILSLTWSSLVHVPWFWCCSSFSPLVITFPFFMWNLVYVYTFFGSFLVVVIRAFDLGWVITQKNYAFNFWSLLQFYDYFYWWKQVVYLEKLDQYHPMEFKLICPIAPLSGVPSFADLFLVIEINMENALVPMNVNVFGQLFRRAFKLVMVL